MQSPTLYVRQSSPDRRPLFMWMMLSGGALLLIGAIIIAPLAASNQMGFLAATLYGSFSHVCHQQPERSFFIAGYQFAVCSRCTGIYFGFALLTLLYPFFFSLRRTDVPDRKYLFLGVAPLAIDFGLGLFDVWDNTHSSRLLTGALFGGVVVFYVMPALAELSLRFKRPSLQTADVSQ